MPLTSSRRKLASLILATGIVLTACSSGDTEQLPLGLDPVVASACEAATPDCDDTQIPGNPDASSDRDEPIQPADQVSSGALANGGLSVAEALATDAAGVLAVRGFIVADEAGARLCDLLAESMPPQCGGASIDLVSLGGVDAALEAAQGVTWTNDTVVIFGEIIDGQLVPNPLVTG